MLNPFNLYVFFAILTIVGGVLLLLLVTCWRTAGVFIRDIWSKPISETVQVLSLLVGIGTTFASQDSRAIWFRSAVAAWTSAGVWKILQIIIDLRIKAVENVDKAELKRAKTESESRTRLLAVLRQAVNDKLKRLRREIARRGDRPSVKQVSNALTPKPHLEEMLDGLAIFLRELLPADQRTGSNIRAGVYVNRDGAMTPIHGVSLDDSGSSPFRSHNNHSEQFMINCSRNPASVVLSVREKRLVIFGDCIKLANQGVFSFFNDNQPSYLKSLAAYYLGEVCLEDGTMTEAALAVDANVAGFFKEEERKSIHFFFEEFACRLKLEMSLLALLSSRSDHEHDS